MLNANVGTHHLERSSLLRHYLNLFTFVATLSMSLAPAMAEKFAYAGHNYRVVEVDLAQLDLKLYWKKSDSQAFHTLLEVRKHLDKDFVFATNAGIYARDLTPLGLHVERGQTLHALNRSRASIGNFFMVPNGIFALTKNGAKIFETVEFHKLKPPVLEATQSGPLLVYRGKLHPRFKPNSNNRKFRSGVGIRSDGRVIFAISENLVSFFEFAQLFNDRLNCPDALYLDGTISSFLDGDNDPGSQFAPYVGILAASKKKGRHDLGKR